MSMNKAVPTPEPLAEGLLAIVASKDATTLEEYLRGRRLPAVGGRAEPAEILARALEASRLPHNTRKEIASLLGQVLEDAAAQAAR